jgi:hypothetical protein
MLSRPFLYVCNRSARARLGCKPRSARRHNSTYPMYEPSRQVIIPLARMKSHYRKSTRGIVMQYIGKSKIGKLSAKGNDYPQLRLPLQYANIVGEVADVFETEHEGKQAFLIVTEHSVPKEDMVLKPSEEVLKPCASVACPSADIPPKSAPASTEPFAPDSRSKSTAESFIIDTWLVSCAASGSRFACASPGSVAAYHGALSRLRLGFKSRLGRSFFASI